VFLELTNSGNLPNKLNSPSNPSNFQIMKIERFEDIEAWQEARKLVKLVYKAVNENLEFKRDFRLVNQIQAAAVSSMSNIAEGFCRKSNKEFIQYLFISKSSAAEVQSELYMWHLIRVMSLKQILKKSMIKQK
jgi:four helix bundle protein